MASNGGRRRRSRSASRSREPPTAGQNVRDFYNRRNTFDGMSDSFVDMMYKRKRSRPPKLSLSQADLFSTIVEDYRIPSPPPYKPVKVIRRTLSPTAKFQLLYATDKLEKANSGGVGRGKMKMKTQYQFQPEGVSIGRLPYIEHNPGDVVIEHLKTGLNKQAMDRIYHRLRRRDRESKELTNLADKLGPLQDYLGDRKKSARYRCTKSSESGPSAQAHFRMAHSSIAGGVKELYATIHETEHRLLHVQAGGDYKDHLAACLERRNVEAQLKATGSLNHVVFNKKPAYSRSSELFSTRSAVHLTGFSRMKEAAHRTAEMNTRKTKQKLFLKKVIAIFSVLSYMKQMKQPKPNPQALPAWLIKRYKHNTELLTSVTFEQNCELQKKVVGRSVKFADAKKSPTSSAASADGRLPAKMDFCKLGAQGQDQEVAPTSTEAMRPKQGMVQLSADQMERRRSAVSKPPVFVQNLEDGVFDPATITWAEFLKVGEKGAKLQMRRENQAEDLFRVYSQFYRKDKEESDKSQPVLAGHHPQRSEYHIWNLLRKSFLRHLQYQKSGRGLDLLKQEQPNTNPRMRMFVIGKTNPVEHVQINWLKVSSRTNKQLVHRLKQRLREGLSLYNTVKKRKEINDTTKWKHQWVTDYRKARVSSHFFEQDQHVECMEVLRREAEGLGLEEKKVIVDLLQKIKKICNDPIIKHTTIYKGQVKIHQLILSLPAYDLCEYDMQAAMQFVLVSVLNGEADMMVPMMEQRGLPLHHVIREQALPATNTLSSLRRKMSHVKITNFPHINNRLSVLPPSKTGRSRKLASHLQDNVYASY